MLTHYKRKLSNSRGEWKEKHLVNAADALKKVMSVNGAAIHFSIRKTALKRRLKTNNLCKGALGPLCLLGVENERNKVHHIKDLQAQTKQADVQGMVKFAERINIKHNFHKEKEKAGYNRLQ